MADRSRSRQQGRLQCGALPVTSDAPSPASVPRSQGGPAENRVPRRSSFVGRARELDQLQAAFEAAASGRGALIMLVGEPGIGKTAVCEQLCRFVEGSGGTPLVGHCYEEGSFRPPYQPFVEVFVTYLQERGTDHLLADLGLLGSPLPCRCDKFFKRRIVCVRDQCRSPEFGR
jgi:hypothetical protein